MGPTQHSAPAERAASAQIDVTCAPEIPPLGANVAVVAADITTDRTSAGVGGAPGCDLVCGGTDWEPYGDTVFVLPKTNGGVVINEGVP